MMAEIAIICGVLVKIMFSFIIRKREHVGSKENRCSAKKHRRNNIFAPTKTYMSLQMNQTIKFIAS